MKNKKVQGAARGRGTVDPRVAGRSGIEIAEVL